MRQEILNKDVQLFQDLICKRSGIYLEGSRLNILRSRLCSRMQSKGFTSPSQYYRFLHFHSEGQKELEELLSYITVNETYFFRNPAHFAALRDHMLTKHIQKENIVRIWSAGCSTGEEPYSIAMTVLDLAPETRIEILGTDVDKEALAGAERGIYRKRSLRITEEEIRGRYFRASNGGFQIDDRLRDMVQFKYFNLMETPYPKPSLGNWDIIFCRNVVIYFNQESLYRVLSSFHSVLADGGYLFMGHSETLTGISCGFSPVEIGDTFVYSKKPYNGVIARDSIPAYARSTPKLNSSSESRVLKKQKKIAGNIKQGAESTIQDAKRNKLSGEKLEQKGGSRGRPPPRARGIEGVRKRGNESPEPSESPSFLEKSLSKKGVLGGVRPLDDTNQCGRVEELEAEDAESIYREASELHAREQLDAALSKIEMYIQLKPENAGGHLLAGRIYADRGIYKRSASEFEKSIELEPLLTEAHYLLGITYQRLGRTTEAIDEFRKSIYIDWGFVLPYFSLACICRSSSMENDALREYNNAVRVLENLPDDDTLPFSGGLTVRLLTQMCLRGIEQLSS